METIFKLLELNITLIITIIMVLGFLIWYLMKVVKDITISYIEKDKPRHIDHDDY